MGLFTIWKRAKPSNITNPTVELGGEKIEVKPLTLENSLRLVLLLAPYVAQIEHKWPRLTDALETTNGTRPKLLEVLLRELQQDLAFAPGDLIQAFALCLNMDFSEVATRATAKDLIEALPVLDSVNDFSSLWKTCKALGVTVNYA